MRIVSDVGIIVICPDILNLYRVLVTFFWVLISGEMLVFLNDEKNMLQTIYRKKSFTRGWIRISTMLF